MESVQVIANILQTELELEDGQISLLNEKWDIPELPGLYIVVGTISGKSIGNKTYIETLNEGTPDITVNEVQISTWHELIQIDLMSFDGSARERQAEIGMALNSFYSQGKQDENSMSIARISTDMLPISDFEDTKILNRFVTTIAVTSLKTKVKVMTDYYDQFQTPEVKVNE